MSALVSLLMRTLNLLGHDPLVHIHLILITSSKAPSPNIVTLGDRSSTYEWRQEGRKYTVHNKIICYSDSEISFLLLRIIGVWFQ